MIETLRACLRRRAALDNVPHHDDQHTQHRFGFLSAGPLTNGSPAPLRAGSGDVAHHVLAGDVFVIEQATPGASRDEPAGAGM
jgi:hypothetical protein